MQPQLIIQGDELLYTNEFDELTYSADHLVQLAEQISKILKNFSYCFPTKDFLHIINKNPSSFIYWFAIDSLFFSPQYKYQLNRINYIRRQKNSTRSSSLQNHFDEQKFITKMRSLSLINKNYQTLQQIKSTTIDQLVQFFEKQHKNISDKNDQKIDQLMMKQNKQKEIFKQNLKNLDVDYLEATSLFKYYKFDKHMIRTWMDQIERNKNGFKCEICNKVDSKLIKCQNCDFIIHAQCYPKLGKNYQKKQFKCQNCQKNLNQKTCCIFCPRKGGHFLQIQCLLQRKSIYKITKNESGLKLKLKKLPIKNQRKLFVHLSCSLWHPQLQYSQKQQKLINIHRIDRSKTQNTCFQCGTNIGITIPCVDQNCRRFYHVQCARCIPLTYIINTKNQLTMQLYCQRHIRCHIYQILKQNILKNLKHIKTFMKSINQVSRMRASNHYIETNYKKYQQNQINERYDYCIYCRINVVDEEINEKKIVNCWKCYNWYHEKCGNKCNICENGQEKGGI